MTRRDIEPTALLKALNDGPGDPHADVRSAAMTFGVAERTVYRRISEFHIRRVYRWELEGPTIQERFEPFVERGVDCWLWNGRRDANGYGRLYFRGRHHYAHRLALELASGEPLTKGVVVMHTCDNPPCVNPSHLRQGTVADNNRDRATKGRSWKARLDRDPDAVAAALRECGTVTSAAEVLGVSRRTIQRHLKRRAA